MTTLLFGSLDHARPLREDVVDKLGHRHDHFGKFAKKVHALKPGEKAELPDGHHVTREKSPVDEHGGAKFRIGHGSEEGRRAVSDNRDRKSAARDAIDEALTLSAGHDHPKSVGGKETEDKEGRPIRWRHVLKESAKTASLSVTHAPRGKGGTNWITRSKPGNTGQLPAYIQNVRNAIIREGKSESQATAIAIGRIEKWASGAGGVGAEVKEAAAKAVAELKAMGAKARLREGLGLEDLRVVVAALEETDALDAAAILAVTRAAPAWPAHVPPRSVSVFNPDSLIRLPPDDPTLDPTGVIEDDRSPHQRRMAQRHANAAAAAAAAKAQRAARPKTAAPAPGARPSGGQFAGSKPGGGFIKAGSSGAEVQGIQARVHAKTDGQFGVKTKAAVESFQRKHGLVVDGIVGRQTFAALAGKSGAARLRPGALSKTQSGQLGQLAALSRGGGTLVHARRRRLQEELETLEDAMVIEAERATHEDFAGRVKDLRQGEIARMPDGIAIGRMATPDGRDVFKIAYGSESGGELRIPSYGEGVRSADEAIRAARLRSARSQDPESLGGGESYGYGTVLNGARVHVVDVTDDLKPVVRPTDSLDRGAHRRTSWDQLSGQKPRLRESASGVADLRPFRLAESQLGLLLERAVVEWDPAEHPRDAFGKFSEKIGGLTPRGQAGPTSVRLPDGTTVTREPNREDDDAVPAGASSYRVVRSGRIVSGFHQPEHAAFDAFTRSARATNSDRAIGGRTRTDFDVNPEERPHDPEHYERLAQNAGGYQRVSAGREGEYDQRAAASIAEYRRSVLAHAVRVRRGTVASVGPPRRTTHEGPPASAPAGPDRLAQIAANERTARPPTGEAFNVETVRRGMIVRDAQDLSYVVESEPRRGNSGRPGAGSGTTIRVRRVGVRSDGRPHRAQSVTVDRFRTMHADADVFRGDTHMVQAGHQLGPNPTELRLFSDRQPGVPALRVLQVDRENHRVQVEDLNRDPRQGVGNSGRRSNRTQWLNADSRQLQGRLILRDEPAAAPAPRPTPTLGPPLAVRAGRERLNAAIAAGAGENPSATWEEGPYTYARAGNRTWSIPTGLLGTVPVGSVQVHRPGEDVYTGPAVEAHMRAALGQEATVRGTMPVARGVHPAPRHPPISAPAGFTPSAAPVPSAPVDIGPAPTVAPNPYDSGSAALVGSVQQIVNSLHGFEHGGLRAKVTRANSSSFVGQVVDRSGRQVGTFSRDVRSGTSIYHALFAIDSQGDRSTGFGAAFIDHSFQTYKTHGFKEVRVTAGLDVGGYMWAKMGFAFASSSGAHDVTRTAEGKLNRLVRAGRISQELLDEFLLQVRDGQVVSPAQIAAWGRSRKWEETVEGKRVTLWLGKALLAGNGWSGVKKL